MFRRTFLGLLAAIGLAGSVQASTISPSIVASAASIFYDPTGPDPTLVAIGGGLVATPPIFPAPDLAVLIDTVGDTITLTVEDVSSTDILVAMGTGFSAGPGGITALLQTVTDTTGLFGPQILASLNISNFDPSAPFSGTGELVVTPDAISTEVIPLPAAAPLLVGGLALLWGVRRRAAA